MVVIADTSIISNLLQIGQIRLLALLYGQVFIPQQVLKELNQHSISADWLSVTKPDWLIVRKIKDKQLLKKLVITLDEGESEAIVLAMESKADYILIDEKNGRESANKFGLKTRGVLGILLNAKQNGHLPQIKPELQKLREVNFWISDFVVEIVLKQADEL